MTAIRTRRSLVLLFAVAFAFALAFTLTADQPAAEENECCVVKDGSDTILAGWWNVDLQTCFCMPPLFPPFPECDYLCPQPR